MMNRIGFESRESNSKLAVWLFFFGLNYAFWHLTVAFLNFEIKNKLMVAELFDLVTPFVMTFLMYRLYGLLKQRIESRRSSRLPKISLILIILGIVFFIEGHGMHLSANAIIRHLEGWEGSPLFDLTYFFDEILGHLFWDGGFVIMSIALLILSFQDREVKPLRVSIWTTVGSLFYGFTYFCLAVEGQTVLFNFPVSVLMSVIILFMFERRRLRLKHPIVLFYFLAYLLAFFLFVYWGITKGGFPQFTELGWI